MSCQCLQRLCGSDALSRSSALRITLCWAQRSSPGYQPGKLDYWLALLFPCIVWLAWTYIYLHLAYLVSVKEPSCQEWFLFRSKVIVQSQANQLLKKPTKYIENYPLVSLNPSTA